VRRWLCVRHHGQHRDTFEEENPDAIADFVVDRLDPVYDWFTPDTVKKAEYYEVEDHEEKLLIARQMLSAKNSAIGKPRSTPTSSPT
jgi:hypothetical protein